MASSSLLRPLSCWLYNTQLMLYLFETTKQVRSVLFRYPLQRRVLIYSVSTQKVWQGAGKFGKGKINFMSTQKWENPLMGWTSTGDPYSNVGDALSFTSEEDAKAFCRKAWLELYGKNYKQ